MQTSPPSKPAQSVSVSKQIQITPTLKPFQTALNQTSKPVFTVAATKPTQTGPVTKIIHTTQANLAQAAQLAQSIQQKKPTQPEASADVSKGATKTMPSLSVVVKPSKTLPDVICQKKRESLGKTES